MLHINSILIAPSQRNPILIKQLYFYFPNGIPFSFYIYHQHTHTNIIMPILRTHNNEIHNTNEDGVRHKVDENELIVHTSTGLVEC